MAAGTWELAPCSHREIAVLASAPGFAEYKVSGIVVATGQTIRSDAQLKLAAVGASVEVQAEAATRYDDSLTVVCASRQPNGFHERVRAGASVASVSPT